METLLKKYSNKNQIFNSDQLFDSLYPENIELKSAKHWTKIHVIKCSLNFLTPKKDVQILDIGSGAGKFCMTAGYLKPEASFYGIEQRKSLINVSNSILNKLEISNVNFIHGNFTQIDFRKFDHFYFFNAFHENLSGTEKIDHEIEYSQPLFQYYNRYLFNQLNIKPAGTRIVTFHSNGEEIPPNYRNVENHFSGLLKFWIKDKVYSG